MIDENDAESIRRRRLERLESKTNLSALTETQNNKRNTDV